MGDYGAGQLDACRPGWARPHRLRHTTSAGRRHAKKPTGRAGLSLAFTGRMTLRRHPPLWRAKDGSYHVELGPTERAVLRELPEQLRQAVSANPGDEAFRRLFPPAYANDPAAEAEYRKLVGHELSEEKLLALETLAKTADAEKLTEHELDTWMRALNDVRLWLGTVLDVTEDEDMPDDPPHALYHMLTWVQSLAVDALSGAK